MKWWNYGIMEFHWPWNGTVSQFSDRHTQIYHHVYYIWENIKVLIFVNSTRDIWQCLETILFLFLLSWLGVGMLLTFSK
jgi:hypothetical protein